MNPTSANFLVIVYILLNALAFFTFIHDKLKAKVRMGRNPEIFLLFVAALGPVGALTAMVVFRHKIRPVKFLLVPVFLIVHLALFFWFWPQVAG